MNIEQQFNNYEMDHQDSFQTRNDIELQREYIRESAIIQSKFNDESGRIEGLICYSMIETTTLEMSSIKVIWVHKLSLNDNSSYGRFTFFDILATDTPPSQNLVKFGSEPLQMKKLSQNLLGKYSFYYFDVDFKINFISGRVYWTNV